jgi:hypothetical protein
MQHHITENHNIPCVRSAETAVFDPTISQGQLLSVFLPTVLTEEVKMCRARCGARTKTAEPKICTLYLKFGAYLAGNAVVHVQPLSSFWMVELL